MLNDATWLLLWQIWQARESEDFHSRKALVHRVLELGLSQEVEVRTQEVEVPPVTLGVCICGQYVVPMRTSRFFLIPGCFICNNNAEEVSSYMSWLHHVLEADYNVRLSTDKIRAAIAIAIARIRHVKFQR